MARIFFSMAGEGRGHATRVRALAERLRLEHELTLFASDEAFEFLHRHYGRGTSSVRLVRIPGLRFQTKGNRFSLPRTIAGAARFLLTDLGPCVRNLERRIRTESPDLIVTDFEPALPRAARRCGRPFVCLNHQHILAAGDFRSLPWRLRTYARAASLAVALYHTGQAETIISSFFRCPLRKRWEGATLVGPMLRPEVHEVGPTDGDHLLSYFRGNTSDAILQVLEAAPREVRLYGMGERPDRGAIRFRAIDEQGFLRDLAGCRAVVSAAGNQLLGESIHFGKPFLALPESHQHEQAINAHFLKQMGGGVWSPRSEFDARRMTQFLDRLDEFRANLAPYRLRWDGTQAAVEALLRHVATARSTPAGAWSSRGAEAHRFEANETVDASTQGDFASAHAPAASGAERGRHSLFGGRLDRLLSGG